MSKDQRRNFGSPNTGERSGGVARRRDEPSKSHMLREEESLRSRKVEDWWQMVMNDPEIKCNDCLKEVI